MAASFHLEMFFSHKIVELLYFILNYLLPSQRSEWSSIYDAASISTIYDRTLELFDDVVVFFVFFFPFYYLNLIVKQTMYT